VDVAQLGYPVGTLIAGLGIGGIAVALAAQKTVENLFGSLSLAADRVFRVGDWVSIDGISGSVEAIGLRSTHIRTLDRTVVKIPNGRLADLRVESFGERDRFRFVTTLRLAYGTSAQQVRRVIADVEHVLRAHPLVTEEAVVVRLSAIGTYSFDVNVQTWLRTTDNTVFEIQRQELLLGIMDAVERAGARLALPAQALVVEREGERAPVERAPVERVPLAAVGGRR